MRTRRWAIHHTSAHELNQLLMHALTFCLCLHRLFYTLAVPIAQANMTLFNAKRKIRMAIYTLITCQGFSGGGPSSVLGVPPKADAGQEGGEEEMGQTGRGGDGSDGTHAPRMPVSSSLDSAEQSNWRQTFTPGPRATQSTAIQNVSTQATNQEVSQYCSGKRCLLL